MVLEYARTVWTPNFTIHHNTFQSKHNDLQIIGSTQTTSTNHLHYKTQVLTFRDHINKQGTQFIAAANAKHDHPCHYMLARQPSPHSIKIARQALYTGLLSTTPQHSNPHIHTHFTNIAIKKLSSNTILGILLNEIHHLELTLPHED